MVWNVIEDSENLKRIFIERKISVRLGSYLILSHSSYNLNDRVVGSPHIIDGAACPL